MVTLRAAVRGSVPVDTRMSVFLRGWGWHWHCLTSLSLTWPVGSSAPPARFVTAPSCIATGTLEGRHVMQRGLDRLERWGCEDLGKLSKAKCRVLQPGQGNP